jgi:hypothetical protein
MWASYSPLEIVRAGRWQSALFTTYALSLSFFEGIILPSLQRAGAQEISLMADLEGVRGALSETGARHVGRAYSVEPVGVSGGIFHPKLGVLHGEESTHLVVGSGNLTFGGWGHNLELFEHLDNRSHPAAFGDAADFLTQLATSSRLTVTNADVLERQIAALTRAAGDALEGPLRLVHNVEAPIAAQLVTFAQGLGGAERLTVASPYFGGIAVLDELASRLELDSYEVHVAELLAVEGTHFAFGEAQAATAVVLNEFASGQTKQRPLHAKLIEIVCRSGRILFSGSVNASRRALLEPANVELGVLRITEERQALARRAFSGALPSLPPQTETSAEPKGPVLQATYVAETLRGQVVGSSSVEGLWRAFVDAQGVRQDLGETVVSASGEFTLSAQLPDTVVYGRLRTTLTLSRGGQRIRGFISFVDLLEAVRRLGPAAGPLLRVAGGADEDGDWITILEWFARNPAQTAIAWRNPSQSSSSREPADVAVSLSALVPQPDPTRAPSTWAISAGDAGTVERLLRRLRFVLRETPSGASGTGRLEDADDESPGDKARREGQRKKLTRTFEDLVTVLSSRVPSDPEPELTRLAEVGLFFLRRHTDEQERVADFLEIWIGLALAHLPQPPHGDELRALSIGMIVLSSVLSRNRRRARRQLIDLLGGDNLPLDLELSAAHLLTLQRLVDAVTTREAWAEVLAETLQTRIALDEVRAVLAALDQSTPLPTVEVLAPLEAYHQLQALLAKGRMSHVHRVPRSQTGCPRCHIRLAQAEREELKSKGLVRATCCSSVLLRSDV